MRLEPIFLQPYRRGPGLEVCPQVKVGVRWLEDASRLQVSAKQPFGHRDSHSEGLPSPWLFINSRRSPSLVHLNKKLQSFPPPPPHHPPQKKKKKQHKTKPEASSPPSRKSSPQSCSVPSLTAAIVGRSRGRCPGDSARRCVFLPVTAVCGRWPPLIARVCPKILH